MNKFLKRHAWWLAMALVVLFVFAMYAPVLRLMPFHDDAVLMPPVSARNLLTVFENRPFGDGHHRPISYIPWILTRDLFGWFDAPILHFWNLAAHALNTVLVGSLWMRFSRRVGQPRKDVAALAALIFGLFPLSYQAVLWASALVHPLMALFGLAAAHAYLSARRSRPSPKKEGTWLGILSAFLLLLSCLSNEAGFVFGGLILVMELVLTLKNSLTAKPITRLLPLLVAMGYPFYYRFALITKWTNGGGSFGLSPADVLQNVAAHSQSLSSFILIWLRPAFDGMSGQPLQFALIGLAALVAVAISLLARRAKTTPIFLAGLMWWLGSIIPSSIVEKDYVAISPRAHYLPAIGGSVIWAICLVALWRVFKSRRVLQMGLVAAFALTATKFVGFAADRLNEAARLTPALNMITADMRASKPNDRVLIVNSSFQNYATHPTFPLGQEGMPIWEYGARAGDATPLWAWPSSTTGIVRETQNVLHAASLLNRETAFGEPDRQFTRGTNWNYAIFGDPADDGALLARALQSNLIYRFDYDPPGLRMERLGVIERNASAPANAQAKFASGAAQVFLEDARASVCEGVLHVDLTWSAASGFAQSAAVFVHGVDSSGKQILVADKDPLGGLLPVSQFPASMRLRETRVITSDALDALNAIQIGVYFREGGQRLPAFRADGREWEGNQISIPVQRMAQCPAS